MFVVTSPRKPEPSLTVKGQPNEDAVLCTNDKTYALRSVALSNSALVVTSSAFDSSSEREAVFIRDELHEILEITPTVPKLHKLGDLLRGREYDESDEPDSESKVRVIVLVLVFDGSDMTSRVQLQVIILIKTFETRYKLVIQNWIMD